MHFSVFSQIYEFVKFRKCLLLL